jgi:hypothetical protein
MRETGPMEIIKTLSCLVQLLPRSVKEAMEELKPRTNPSLFTWCFLMYSMMFPCAIHSETVINCPFSISPWTPTSFNTFGWDTVFQRTISLQNCWIGSDQPSLGWVSHRR